MSKKKSEDLEECNPHEESCKCELTEEEIREASDALARKFVEIENAEAEKKEVASQFKADIDRLKNAARELAAKVRNKYEYRKTDCVDVFDFSKNEVRTYRVDTAQELRKRTMTVKEKQRELDV